MITFAIKTIPLTSAEPGVRYEIVSVSSGQGVRGHLFAMGFVTGMAINVVRQEPGKSLVLDIFGGRLALGRDMAENVLVRVFEG